MRSLPEDQQTHLRACHLGQRLHALTQEPQQANL